MWKYLVGIAVWLLSMQLASANPQRGLPDPPVDLDRSTPSKTVELFQTATEQGQFERAAYALDLRRIAKEEQAEVAPDLALQLRFVLDRLLPLEANIVSNEQAGNPEDGGGRELLGEMHVDELDVPVELQLVPDGKGGAVWLFSANTVRSIAVLYERIGPGWLGRHAPAWSFRLSFFGLALWQLLALAVVVVIALLVGWIIARLTLAVGQRIAKQTHNPWDDAVLARLRAPTTLLLTVMLFDLGLALVKLTAQSEQRLGRVTQFIAILAATWFVVRVIRSLATVALTRIELDSDVVDGVVRHGRRSRVQLSRQVAVFVAYFVGVALGLMQFESVRQIGVSLLASAGVVGVVVGIAAQKSVANLLAGIQISWAQPFRIGDRVKISEDVGWIEEVTFTYVAMKTWDGRRRMFPITYFTENEFENWSRTDASKVAIVMVHADYSLPIEQLREAVKTWLDTDPDWDHIVFGLVVFDTTEFAMVLRLIASSPDAGRAFDLGCRMREKIVGYLQNTENGRYLPKRRAVNVSSDGGIAVDATAALPPAMRT
jgi:small-conductance mechanosensitive channel